MTCNLSGESHFDLGDNMAVMTSSVVSAGAMRADPWCCLNRLVCDRRAAASSAPLPAHLLLAVRGDDVDADLAGGDAVSHALRRGLLHGRRPRGVPRLHAVPVEVEDRLRCDRRVLPPNACRRNNNMSPRHGIHSSSRAHGKC